MESDKKKAAPSSVYWYAIYEVPGQDGIGIANAKTQKELKKGLSELGPINLTAIIKGKMFGVKIKNTYDFESLPVAGE